MLLSAVSVLVVAQSSSEIPEGLMNNPVFRKIPHMEDKLSPSYEHDRSVLMVHNSMNLLPLKHEACLHLFLCLLTSFSRVILEKRTGYQLVNKFPAFY